MLCRYNDEIMGYLTNTGHGGTIQAWNEVGDMEGFS